MRTGGQGGAGRFGPAAALLTALVLGCAEPVEPPTLASEGGRGPLAIVVSAAEAPEYHHPAGWWRSNHPALVARGPEADEGRYDYSPRECLVCHDPKTSCHRCHAYAGVAPVLEEFEGQ